MSNFSNQFENLLLDHALGTTAFTPPPALYFALTSIDVAEATSWDAAGEPVVGSYARAMVKNSVRNIGLRETGDTDSITNKKAIEFPVATASWGTKGYWACFSTTHANADPVVISGIAVYTGNRIITMDPSDLSVGLYVSGSGIPAGTWITAVSGGSIVISQKPTVSETVALTFTPVLIASGPLTEPVIINSGTPASIPAGGLSILIKSSEDVAGFTPYGKRKILGYLFGRSHPYPLEKTVLSLGSAFVDGVLSDEASGPAVTFGAAADGAATATFPTGTNLRLTPFLIYKKFTLNTGTFGIPIFSGTLSTGVQNYASLSDLVSIVGRVIAISFD